MILIGNQALFFERISNGYLSLIHFIFWTFWSVSGIIASFGPSPYHDFGITLDTITTARGPVTFQLQFLENLSRTYSRVPKFLIYFSVILRLVVDSVYES